jgi:ATP-dependent helicase/nuclease subunit B
VPTLSYVESTGSAERLEAALAFLTSFPPGTELLVIGASREAADDLARAIARARGTSFGLHRFTLGQYASRAAAPSLAEHGLALCTPLGADAVAARAAFEGRRRGALSYLAPVVGCPGLPRALASTLNELRQARVRAGELRELPPPGPDLATLLDEYERQLAHAHAADRAALLFTAAQAIRSDPVATLATLPALLLDLRVSSPAEQAIVDRLVSASPSVMMTVPGGDQATRRYATAVNARAVSVAARSATKAGVAEDETAGGRSFGTPSLARLRNQLFAEAAAIGEVGDDVEFFSAPGESRECVEVARRVLREAARGVPFDEMAVVLRAPETYWGLLEHALQRAGIKAWFARGTRRPDPSGRAFLALLACAGDGLSARRFAEYLSLAQVPARAADGAPPRRDPPWVVPQEETLAAGQLSLFELLDEPRDSGLRTPGSGPESLVPAPGSSGKRAASPASTLRDSLSNPRLAGRDPGSGPGAWSPEPGSQIEPIVRTPRKWEALIVESSVIGGASRWERRLAGLAEELRLKIAEASSEEVESPIALALERDLAHLDDLRSFALPVIRELAQFPDAAMWGAWLDRLEALAPRVLRHPERVLELLAELRPMAGVGPLTLAEVREVLTPRLATLEREPPKHRYGRLFVCTPAQLRGHAFRVVFVTGLAERVFPQKSRQDPLLLDPLRRALDAPLDVEDDRVLQERLLLRLAVGAARERLYLSYPRVDVAQARPRVPSFYALDIVRALTGSVPNYELFERNTATRSGAWLAWPAPADPADAIDDGEHDLAVLGPLLMPGSEPRTLKGQAHYLLQLNPRLRQSLLTRWARWKKTWSSFDGLVKTNDATKAALAGERLGARPYSVSALQRFAACPYQFLLGSIYRFQPLEQPEYLERLDPLTKGALFHEIQRDVLRALKASHLIPLEQAKLPEAFAILDGTVDAVAERYHDRLAPAIERVWQDEIEALRGDLRTWLSRLRDVEMGWEPWHFEFSFGLPLDDEHDPASVAEAVRLDQRFLLRGAIDLIERNPLTGQLRVTDHKTGKNRTTPYLVVGGGGTLQPVIYGMVVEEVFQRTVSQARLYFATTAGGFTEHEVSLRDEAKRAGLEVLEIIDRAVEAAQLPAAPREGACGLCDFQSVCGPLEERRFRDKAKDPAIVGDLLDLRRMR